MVKLDHEDLRIIHEKVYEFAGIVFTQSLELDESAVIPLTVPISIGDGNYTRFFVVDAVLHVFVTEFRKWFRTYLNHTPQLTVYGIRELSPDDDEIDQYY